jgi:hypothetical protein
LSPNALPTAIGGRFQCFESAIVPILKFHQVATIRYISENTNIPVNTVYAFDNDLDNAVGVPYILLQLVSVYATRM